MRYIVGFLSILLITFTSCEKEKNLNLSTEVPVEITNYVTTHFPNNKIIQAIEDIDGFEKTYDILLEGSIFLEFNRKKEIIEIDSKTALPSSVIPSKIWNYVVNNFPENFITDWELESKKQHVGLDNDWELEFTLSGDFIRIDD